jgi:hypothetical protein
MLEFAGGPATIARTGTLQTGTLQTGTLQTGALRSAGRPALDVRMKSAAGSQAGALENLFR